MWQAAGLRCAFQMPKKKIPWKALLSSAEAWRPYKELASYIYPYKSRFLMGLGCGVAFAAVNAMLPLMAKIVGDEIFPGATQEEILQKAQSGEGAGLEGIIWVVALIPLVMITRSIFSYLNAYCMAWVSFRVLRDMRRKLFAHLVRQSFDFFNRSKSGMLISRVMNDTRMAQNALIGVASSIFKDPISVIGGVGVLVYLDWRFSLTSLVLFPLAILPVAIYGRKVRQAGKAEENEAGAMAVILQESFAGIRVIKSFAREEYQIQQFDSSSAEQCRNSMRVRKSIEIVQPLIEAVAALGVVLAILYVYFAGLSAGKFLALMSGIFLLYEPVKRMSRIPMNMQKCLSAATNVFDLLALTPSVVDKKDAKELEHARGAIAFRDVTFAYGESTPAVEGIDLEIEDGKKYALVGASGAGKSTMLSLILRFYDPQQGGVYFDGQDIRDIKLESLRENIGIVTQETFLFHDTIYENIRYGRLDATEAEIHAAAKLAYAHEFIMAQPEGYNTIIGDKGCMISGGQQQRLAIARALLKNAPVLLLDEATSALDSESEKAIQAALERLSKGRTVVAIAHRLSTVLNSDCIVVMEQGRIVETGTHVELMERSPQYRRLYELQFLQHEEVPEADPAVPATA